MSLSPRWKAAGRRGKINSGNERGNSSYSFTFKVLEMRELISDISEVLNILFQVNLVAALLEILILRLIVAINVALVDLSIVDPHA